MEVLYKYVRSERALTCIPEVGDGTLRATQPEVEPIIWTGSGRSYVRIPALLPVIRSPLPVNPSFH